MNTFCLSKSFYYSICRAVIMRCSLQSVEQCEAHSKASSVENAKNATYSICLSTLAVASSAMYRMFFLTGTPLKVLSTQKLI